MGWGLCKVGREWGSWFGFGVWVWVLVLVLVFFFLHGVLNHRVRVVRD